MTTKVIAGFLKLRILRGFGYFEGIQDSATQLQGIREIFQAWREGLPMIVTK